jgi:hypothetical protein
MVDSHLLEEVDKLTNNRSAAFEEGIRLWYAKQIEELLRKSYQSRTRVDVAFEGEWATFVQEQMEDNLRVEEGL